MDDYIRVICILAGVLTVSFAVISFRFFLFVDFLENTIGDLHHAYLANLKRHERQQRQDGKGTNEKARDIAEGALSAALAIVEKDGGMNNE